MLKQLNNLPDTLSLKFDRTWLTEEEHYFYFSRLQQEVDWKQERITLFGKTHWQPRLLAWQGNKDYAYSGKNHAKQDFTPTVVAIKERLLSDCQLNFNGVLLNRYRNGKDSMGWHSDDEKELGMFPIIASVSLGAERKIRFRNKTNHRETFELFLPPGSLLVMHGATQELWQHSIPKTTQVQKERINLTFRFI